MKILHNPFCLMGHWKLFKKGRNGMAIWPFILVRDIENKTLICHEQIHIRQQLKGWLVFFYIKYFYYNMRYGYKNNPYEIEANAHQEDWRK